MSIFKDGGPAFPSLWINDSDSNATAPSGAFVGPGGTEQMFGATLRDYFAAKVVGGLLADPNVTLGQGREKNVARLAYEVADAMLEARGAA